jgi:SAM-dependent methyltransferase
MSAQSRDEGLAEAARLARERAPALCRRDPASGESCAWHHGLWPTLRLLGLVTEPALHGEFLRASLAGIAGERPRVLLSGAADHALLALALAALGGRDAQFTVLDICETPLLLNRHYAERANARVTTRRSNILAFENATPYDAICTHAFLGNFDSAQRAALAGKWHALLRPGGKLITVNRLRPGRDAQWVAFSVDQVWAFRERVERAAAARALEYPGLGRAAEKYASRLTVFPLGSAQELRALFESAGFAVEQLSIATVAPAARQQINVPTVPGGDDYAQLIAVRR